MSARPRPQPSPARNELRHSRSGGRTQIGAVRAGTTVTLPAGWTARARGTYLDLGRVAGGSTQVYVNGRLASPSPVSEERIDVSSLLREGDNELEVEFASTLRNKWLAVTGEDGAGQAYGLRGPVRLIPFGRATVEP